MEYISRASRFCEAVHATGVAQPANSWSAAIFLIVSLVIVWQVRLNRESTFATRWGYLYAIIVALIGLGTFANHATLTQWGGTWDVASMFLLATFLILHALSRLINLSSRLLVLILVAVNIPLTYIASLPGSITDMVFAFLVIGVIGLELLVYYSRRYSTAIGYFWLAILVLLLAYGVWQLDVQGVWCNPTSLIQGHALWHILSSASIGLFYVYLSRERQR